MDEKVGYWAEIAEYDLETAQAMLRTERYLYVGFMCYQAIEKILKACYQQSKNAIPPKTDNLRLLAEETGLFSLLSEEQKSFLLVLEPLNFEFRHPEYRERISMALNQEKCRELLKSTQELHAWIKARLLEKPDNT